MFQSTGYCLDERMFPIHTNSKNTLKETSLCAPFREKYIKFNRNIL